MSCQTLQLATAKTPKLFILAKATSRAKHYCYRNEQVCIFWIKRFIFAWIMVKFVSENLLSQREAAGIDAVK